MSDPRCTVTINGMRCIGSLRHKGACMDEQGRKLAEVEPTLAVVIQSNCNLLRYTAQGLRAVAKSDPRCDRALKLELLTCAQVLEHAADSLFQELMQERNG